MVAVAYSGGRDSTALLHAAARAARTLGLRVIALHVHHGLMAEADGWLDRARATCARWRARGLPLDFRSERLAGAPAAGESVEAWARRERYRALARMARAAGAALVLLGHHRRDQAETVLLQALRGAGPAGLSAMPLIAERDGLAWARPWRDRPREAIEAYLVRHRLGFVDDPSNAGPRFARSRLRTEVWPALAAAFPSAEASLALAAARAHEADALLREVAAADLSRCADAQGLDLAAWSALSPPRRANLLRAWLAQALGHGAPEALVQRLLHELPGRGTAAATWPLQGASALGLFRGRLGLHRRAVDGPATGLAPAACELDLSRPGRYELPAFGGRLEVRACRSGGVAAAWLRACVLKPRAGGERFQAQPQGLPRALKKQFQQGAVPAWARSGPLVWSGDRLVFVPGLGIDARCWSAGEGARRQLAWRPGGGRDRALG